MPEAGVGLDEALRVLFDRATPTGYNTAGPGYLAYIPGGGIFAAALADLIADSVNRYVGVWAAAPGMVQLEQNVVRWLCDIVGYPDTAGGLLASGGSLAGFSAIVAARRDRLPEDFLSGTIYASDQTHHAVAKAAILAGFPARCVREVPTDGQFRMRVDALARLVAEDREAGLRPFMVVGNAGTTNTGAVDDLEAIADLAERQALWFHVDAAYGGFFMLTERGRQTMQGIARADSVVLDPHKGLFLPYGTGAVVVREPEALRRAHEADAAYMPIMQDEADFVDYCAVSPELSRPFRGLRVWLPFKLVGASTFRAYLDEKLDLAHWAAERLRELPGIELVAPELSLLAFRYARPGLGREELNRLNRDLIGRINARQRIYLTGTTTKGDFLIRICVLSFRTHRKRMEEGMADIEDAVRELDRAR